MSAVDLWELDVEPIDPVLNHYSINLVGADGSGKTSFMIALMSKMGKTFTLGFEDRFKAIPGAKVVKINSWKSFLDLKKDIKKKLKNGRPLPFDCCSIDTVGEAALMGKKYIMDENGWEELKGDQYNIVGQGITDEIRDLRRMGFVTNFVSHDKSRELTSATGSKYNQTVPDALNQIKHLVQGDCDFILYLEVVNEEVDGEMVEKRRLWIHGHPMVKLKTALYGMPKYIEFTNVKEGVDKFVEAFNEGVRITQEMQDNDMDVSNPNADNNTIVEEKHPVTRAKEDEDDFTDDAEEPTVPEVAEEELKKEDALNGFPFNSEDLNESAKSIKELREEAKAVRDDMLEKLGATETKKIMKEMLGGTIQVNKVEDPSLLEAFIKKYK